MPSPLSRRSFLAAPLAAGVGLVAVSSGCASHPEASGPSASPTGSDAATPSPAVAPTPTGPPPLPGLAGNPVLAVKIDHTPASYPRVGISQADVVYVEPVEAGLTRFLAVFDSVMPAAVGPVRSARESDVNLLANYGKVAFAFSGASAYTLGVIGRGAQVNLSNDESPQGYRRDGTRHAPYNLIGSPAALLSRAGGSVPPGSTGFGFGPAIAGGTPATKVATSWQAASMSFTYDPGSKRYLVTSDGRPEVDAGAGGARASAGTVVVQQVAMSLSANRDVNGQPTPIEDVLGQGEVTVVRDGQAWRGTWSRANPGDPTAFSVAGPGGREQIAFQPGAPVWVLLVPTGQAVTIS